MTLSGLHFTDGYVSGGGLGGALWIEYSLVSLQGCKLSSNQASHCGGFFVQSSSTTVNLYTTIFDGNLATISYGGNDMYVSWSASLTVHSTCPPDWSGTPAAGSDLDTYTYNGGTISGTTKSFDIG